MCSDVTSGRQKVDTQRWCPIVIITSFVFETASSTDTILQTLDKAGPQNSLSSIIPLYVYLTLHHMTHMWCNLLDFPLHHTCDEISQTFPLHIAGSDQIIEAVKAWNRYITLPFPACACGINTFFRGHDLRTPIKISFNSSLARHSVYKALFTGALKPVWPTTNPLIPRLGTRLFQM